MRKILFCLLCLSISMGYGQEKRLTDKELKAILSDAKKDFHIINDTQQQRIVVYPLSNVFAPERTHVYCSFIIRNNQADSLCIGVRHSMGDWFKVERCTFTIGGKEYKIETPVVSRGFRYKFIIDESKCLVTTKEQVELIRLLGNTKGCSVHFDGRGTSFDKKVTQKERYDFLDGLELYEKLNGKLP